ncbi:MAG: ABC transporter ATP-binding protein [Gammaproteobacteria bacterium]|nr:ABC transporter ATP-binding protein [Gammaproteobacteria bacterium]MCF6229654.1 ABC transporter ATP-binding protein [Gammaproteobacteria bacterium]
MPNTDQLLELNNITQRYGETTVVQAMSLSLKRGEIGCLLGPSGCGKTTVLRCIAGFETVQDGNITLSGKQIAGSGQHLAAEKRRIGMVFQDYALFPHLSAAENIAFGLQGESRHEKQQRVTEMLALIDMPQCGELYPHELSGGQQQRIALARALAPRPSLLLMDEPFSNLDVTLRERLCLDVRDILKQEQATAILVTHDQQEAFMVADVIGVMNEGRIQQWDSAYNLYHRPKNRFVANFIGEGVFLPGKVVDSERVEIELGVIDGEFDAPCCADCGVDVLLRPDDVLHDDHSSLQAVVKAKAFRGAQILYTLELPTGSEILSLVPSHHNHPIGEPIGIRLDTDHVITFRI